MDINHHNPFCDISEQFYKIVFYFFIINQVMNTLSSGQSLYEIPNCTICLNQLCQDLSNLNCGHVFHLNCISQHFQYRGTCPNCQKRSNQKEVRMVIFPMSKNTQAVSMMRELLGNLSVQQKQQIQTLFKQYQRCVQKCQKLQRQYNQSEKQNKKLTAQLNQTKSNQKNTKLQIQTMRKDCLELKKVIEHVHGQKKALDNENLQLRVQIQTLKQKQADFQKIKKLKKIMGQNSMSLIAYKNQLQSKSTPPEQMAKLFFDMIMIKNLDIVKLKGKIQGYPQKIQQKQHEIRKIKQTLERQRKDIKDVNERMNTLRKKYQDLKLLHRKLIQKYKAKCSQALSQQQNYQDSMLSKPTFPLSSLNRQSSINANTPNNNNIFSMGINSQIRQQNNPSNVNTNNNNGKFNPKQENKNSSFSIFDSMIMEEESSNNTSKNNNNGLMNGNNGQRGSVNGNGSIQTKKRSLVPQGNLNSFVTQKSSFGTYGGIAAKKKAQDKKTSIKNLFG